MSKSPTEIPKWGPPLLILTRFVHLYKNNPLRTTTLNLQLLYATQSKTTSKTPEDTSKSARVLEPLRTHRAVADPEVDLFAGMKKKKKKQVQLDVEDTPPAPSPVPDVAPAPEAPATESDSVPEPVAEVEEKPVAVNDEDLFADMKKKKKKKKEIPLDLVSRLSPRSLS